MGYPRTVEMEYCHRHRVWRSFDGAKIVAYHEDDDVLAEITPNHHKIRRSETAVNDGNGGKTCICRIYHPYRRSNRSNRGGS